jgi:chemotaxis protein MotB
MNKFLRPISLFLALGIFTVSCISNRKFTEEVKARESAQAATTAESQKRQAAEDAKIQADVQIASLKKELGELQVKYDKLNATYESQMIAYERLQKTNDDLRKTYESILAMNDRLVKENEGRKKELSDDNKNKEEELRRKAIEIADKEAELRREREALERMRQEMQGKDNNLATLEAMKKELEKGLADREKRVKELEQSIADRDAKAKALKDKLNEALKGFQASDLTVEERNGRVYVSLSQNLLFASGSSKLDSKGASALVKLTEVLNKNADIAVLIEGHTDSDGDEKTNWRLSSERSLSITDELIKNKLAPERITAAGRGEHSPIASNDTPDGKAKNRRTDIILSPKLDVIYDMLKK